MVRQITLSGSDVQDMSLVYDYYVVNMWNCIFVKLVTGKKLDNNAAYTYHGRICSHEASAEVILHSKFCLEARTREKSEYVMPRPHSNWRYLESLFIADVLANCSNHLKHEMEPIQYL